MFLKVLDDAVKGLFGPQSGCEPRDEKHHFKSMNQALASPKSMA